jgi:dienelactone hydrolase
VRLKRPSALLSGFLVALAATGCARPERQARIETREVEYRDDGTALKGLIAWDAALAGKRPGVLVVHEWWGHNEYTRQRARRLAEAGYVGMALDMFGGGKSTSHAEEAQAFVTEATRDPTMLARRFNAALEQLKRDPAVDSTRVAAIGYCFGGMVVLSMAKAGADLDAVATFHGALPPGPVDSGKVRARVLVLTGDADPFVPTEGVEAFRTALEHAGANVTVVTYRGAKHGFTNPQAGSYNMPQLAYDARADSASWEAMRRMLGEVWPEN